MIYIITHKIFVDPNIDYEHYTVLHVGSNGDCRDAYLRDDIKDNISDKNKHYCELTGQYWIWKNGCEGKADITGLVHYRRYFTSRLQDFLYTYCNVKPASLSYKSIKKALGQFDIILPSRETIFRTVYQYYGDLHDAADLDCTREIIKEICPEYLTDFDLTMNAHYYYYGNMLICRKDLFDQYSAWLFPIMFELEKRIDLQKNGDPYQARVMGFISERLLQVWVIHQNVRVKEYPVFNKEERRMTIFQKNFNRIMHFMGRKTG